MQDDELKVMFRKHELEARKKRRDHLLHCLANEGALGLEILTPEDQEAHDKAMIQILWQEQQYQRELERARYGYWQRLWRALINAR